MFGGTTGTNVFSSLIKMYDPALNMWSAIQSTAAPTPYLSAVNFKRNVFVIVVWNQEGSKDIFLRIYDVDKNEWKPCASVPHGLRCFLWLPLEFQETF